MKDIVQDKLSSADVDERRPANRNKWDGFDLNLTCCFRKPSSILRSPFLSISLTSMYNMEQIHKPVFLTGNKTDVKIYWAIKSISSLIFFLFFDILIISTE